MTAQGQNTNAVHPEPERKFLVLSCSEPQAAYDLIQQAYLHTDLPSARVRLVTPFDDRNAEMAPRHAYLTIKTRPTPGDWEGQQEFEVEIPVSVGSAFIVQKGLPFVSKKRRKVGDFDFDDFGLALIGLRLLEIELSNPKKKVVIPDGFEVIEVTNNRRFGNAQLALIQSNQELRDLIASVVEERGNG